MKKLILCVLVLITVIGCKSKEDKVMDALKKSLVNSPTSNATFYCMAVYDLYKIPETQTCGTKVAELINKGREEFKTTLSETIKGQSVNKSVQDLEDSYLVNEKGIASQINREIVQPIAFKAADSNTLGDLSTLNMLKITNLSALIHLSLIDDTNYVVDATDITKNDSVDWQKSKALELFKSK